MWRPRRIHTLIPSTVVGALLGAATTSALAGSVGHEWLIMLQLLSVLALGMVTRAATGGLRIAALLLVAQCAVAGPLSTWVRERAYRARWPAAQVGRIFSEEVGLHHIVDVIQMDKRQRALVVDGTLRVHPQKHRRLSHLAAEVPARLLGRPATCVLAQDDALTAGALANVARSVHVVAPEIGLFDRALRHFKTLDLAAPGESVSREGNKPAAWLNQPGMPCRLVVDETGLVAGTLADFRTRQNTRDGVAALLKPGGLWSLPLAKGTSDALALARREVREVMIRFPVTFALEDEAVLFVLAAQGENVLSREAIYQAMSQHAREAIRIMDAGELATWAGQNTEAM
jgi:hypothetical protein